MLALLPFELFMFKYESIVKIFMEAQDFCKLNFVILL